MDVVTTSAETGDGVDNLLAHIPAGGTIVLLGPSGAGKSTLINALVGHHVQDTGEVRTGDFKGKHTTTSRELVPLSNGTVLMDTPGVRGFGLFDAEDGLGEMFGDEKAAVAWAPCQSSGACSSGKAPSSSGCRLRLRSERASPPHTVRMAMTIMVMAMGVMLFPPLPSPLRRRIQGRGAPWSGGSTE